MISVIIPVFNSAPYLAQCLDSVLGQTYGDLQVICVDDGSTDASPMILEQYAQKDSRILVLTQANSGVSAARNAGLDKASGGYITFVDSDDILEPDMYEVLLGLLHENWADIAHCGYKRICLDGSEKDVQGTGCKLIQDSLEAAECLIAGRYFTGGLWNKLYRADLFSGIRFDTALKINEDVLLNCQLFRKARTVVFWDVPKYHYFERPNSSCSRTKRIKKRQDCVRAAESILALYQGTRLEELCTTKLQRERMELYRVYLMTDAKSSSAERRDLHVKIQESIHATNSRRIIWNYRFMRYLPALYCMGYRVYDRIRKPKWDL